MVIGFIGLGIMGKPMSRNLLKKRGNDTVLVYDLDPKKIQLLVNDGAKSASSAKEIVEKSDVILSIIPKSEHVHALCKEVLPAFRSGKIWADMGTIDPDASVEVAEEIKKIGAEFLDCPLVKSKAAAIDGTLGIYVGVNEMILLAQKTGISPETFEKAISYGGGQNFYLSGKYKNIQNNDFPTAFSVENMHKDVYIVERLTQQCGLKLQGMEITKRVYDHAMEKGLGKEDFSATFKAVKDIAEK